MPGFPLRLFQSNRAKAFTALLIVFSSQVGTASAQAPPKSAPIFGSTDLKFFEDKIRPLLATHCYKCHAAEKQRGDLRLDSRAAILKGGESGPAALPGKPEESLLVLAVRHGEAVKMPPLTKLPATEIAHLAAWVKMGLPWPETAKVVVTPPSPPKAIAPNYTPEQKSFWAFQKPIARPSPQVKDRAWVKSPIDAFILAGLEAKGLRPAPAADKRTLIRRVTFDLIGLPPTPAEVDAFLADSSSPKAFARVVNRLLASNHYGERWGRRWLDVARYADSNGMDENLAHGNAWRYRDYVINAFNRDKPYDQFVREQIAGDLLPPTGDLAVDNDRLVATGFLCIGPKMLAEDDPVKMQMDIVDEQIDTVGQAFLGLTLGCARCHDHKFDPLSMADYYGLAGIFKSTKTMDNFSVVAQWHERPLATPEALALQKAHGQQLAAKKAAFDQRQREIREQTLAEARRQTSRYLQVAMDYRLHRSTVVEPKVLMADGKPSPTGAVVLEAETFVRGNARRVTTGYGEKIGVILDGGRYPNDAEFDITLPAAGAYQLEIRYAAAEPRAIQMKLNGQPIGEATTKATGGWNPDKQAWSLAGVFSFVAGKNTLRFERASYFPHIDKLALVPWQLPDGRPAPLPQTPEVLAQANKLNAAFLRLWVAYLDKTGKAPEGEAIAKVANDPQGPFQLTPAVEANYPKGTLDELQRLKTEVADLEKKRPMLPAAMAVEDGKPENVRIHLRGNHLTQGAEAPRVFPRIIAGDNQVPPDAKQSGRLPLAQWITRPDHPLTARVLVNRIWLGHFGDGLVASVDNFGRLGERPSHPELLDWLAVRFVEEGWSIKKLHRLMLLSSAYQQATKNPVVAEKASIIDPDNRLLWHANRQRLDAESLRDSLLALSGRLDPAMGGSLFKGNNRAYVPGYPSSNYNGYDSDRRTVYLPVIRSDVFNVLQTFDFADPSVLMGKRPMTTVAPQALFMMNGKLVQDSTRLLAQNLLAATEDDAGRLRLLYEKAYCRPPTPRDLSRSLDFLGRYQRELATLSLPPAEHRLRSWQALARVVLSANEFLFVE